MGKARLHTQLGFPSSFIRKSGFSLTAPWAPVASATNTWAWGLMCVRGERPQVLSVESVPLTVGSSSMTSSSQDHQVNVLLNFLLCKPGSRPC